MTQLGTKKSRRGCKRCKARRVKCNEEAPCNNCVRRNEECSLLEPSPAGSDAFNDPALPTNADEWIEDLALMHHYTSNTTSFGPRGNRVVIHELWRDYIPYQATKHKFLMHGLLALSALHLASLHPDQATKYARLCDKHQAIALTKYRSILSSDIDPDSADALFAFASTLSLSTMARSCSPIMMGPSKGIDLDAVVELFYLTRGVRDVIDVCYVHIKEGPMAQMFHGHSFSTETVVTLPDAIATRFGDLAAMLEAARLDPEALQHCRAALSHLEDIYKNIVFFSSHDNVLETGQVWRWAVMVPTGYIRLVTARIAPALVILAYYAAATTAIRTAWYTEDWGSYTLQGIETELDEEYLHWLDWPKEQGARRMDILGVHLPEDDGRGRLIGF